MAIINLNIEEATERARKGTSVLFVRRLIAVLITFVSTVTIARLVTPEAFGLANMSSVLLALALVFRDFGLTNAMMRKAEIDPEELSFLFWLNAGLVTLVTALLAIAAPFAASFYHEPVVTWVILVSLIGFFVSGITQQHVALMNRNLRFGTVAIVDTAALIVGFATTLAIALVRRDVWAIVFGSLAQLIVASILFTVLSGWRPGKPQRPRELGALLKFGVNSSLYSISVFLSNNIAIILIGHFLGASPLGQFNRAQALFQLPTANITQPIVAATLPLLARLSGHADEYRAAYARLQRQLTVFLFPLAVTLSFAAIPLMIALLGIRWELAGQVLAALAPTLGAHVFGYAAGDLFLTQNRSAELRTLGLVELVIRVSAVAALIPYGLVWAACGFTISTFAAAALRVFVVGRIGPVNRIDQLRAAGAGVPPTIGSVIACLAATAVTPDEWLSPWRAAIVIIAGATGALLVGLIFPGSRRALGEFADAFGVSRVLKIIQRRARSIVGAP